MNRRRNLGLREEEEKEERIREKQRKMPGVRQEATNQQTQSRTYSKKGKTSRGKMKMKINRLSYKG